MKTDVRLRPSWRKLLLLQAALLQHARTIVAQAAASSSASYPNTTDTTTTSTQSFSCAPCSVSVAETMLSFPVHVNVSTQLATATVIPYITEYPDGTNVTSFSTYSSYTQNATSQNNFTTPTTTPLTWTTLGFTLTYPTTYIAFPTPEAGINSAFVVNGTSYCYAENFTVLTNLPSASVLFPYNASIFGAPATTRATPTDNTGGELSIAGASSSGLTSAPLATAENTAYASLASSLLSFLDGLSQLSAIVSTAPSVCSQTVGPLTPAATVALTLTSNTVPTAPVVHTSVAVLTQTGQAVITTATGLPDTTGSETGNGNGGEGSSTGSSGRGGEGSSEGGGGSNNGGGEGSSGSGSSGSSGSGSSGNSGSGSSGSSGNSGSGSSGSGSGGNSGSGSGSGSGSSGNGNSGNGGGGIGAVVASAAANYASTAVITPAPTGGQQVITVGSSAFVVSAETGNAGGGIVIGGGYATLAPGSGIAINGVPISYEVSGSTTALIVGGSTIPLSVATATAGIEGVLTFGGQSITESNGEYIIGGTTLTPGGEVVVGGTTISLAPGGSVAVVNGQTETLATATVSGGTGGAIMSGIGVTGSSTASSTSTHKAAAQSIDAPGWAIVGIAGVVGALGLAL